MTRLESADMKTAVDIRPALNTSARVLGKTLIAPVIATVLLLAPVVYLICSVMMVGGVLAAVLFEVSAVGPRFPFLQVVGISLLFGVVMALYYALVAVILRE